MMRGFRKSLLVSTSFTAAFGAASLALVAPAAAQTTDTSAQSSDGDQIVVTGYARSLADSAATKRKANAIVDVISAEDVGKFPDRNIAESLSHLPGVTVDHQFGEGEQVSIAGVEPALNRILIDGHSVASADWGGNPSDRSSRSFNYSLLSPEIISQAIVYKTPEARLQEGAIGGTVDVVTRKPLDLKPNTITASAGYAYNDRSDRGSPRGSILYSWHNDAGTFGVLGSVGFDRQYLARAGVAVYGYMTGSTFFQKDANGNAVTGANGQPVPINPALQVNGGSYKDLLNARLPAYLAHEYFQQTRQRLSFSGAVQWKPADNLTLTATGLVIRGKYDNFSNSEFSYNTRGNLLQSATVTNGLITSATFGASSGKAWNGELDTNYRRTRIQNDSGTLLMNWDVNGWNVSGNVGWTRASGGKNPEYLLSFRTLQGFTVGANGRNTLLNWTSPASDGTQWVTTAPAENAVRDNPTIRAANGGNPFTGAQIGGITNADQTLDKEKFAQADFSRDVEFGPFTKIIFGGRYSDHLNKQSTFGGATYTATGTNLQALGAYTLNSGLYDGLSTSGNGTPYATLTQDAVISALTGPGTLNVTYALDTGSYFKVKEQIGTGYVQGDFESGKFRGNIGGRFVHTRDTSFYYLTSNNTTTLVVAPRNDDRFLPAFNLAYDAGPGVVLRIAAAKVIARPRYSQLAGAVSLDDTTRTGGGGNPDLKPYAATNYGLSAEWYFTKSGYISGEIFYRDISNYISNQNVQQSRTNQLTGQTLDYAISTPVNGGKATVTGFSLTAQTPIAYGFGIQANYTFADADTGINGQGLPYLSRDTYNIVPYFESGPFQARVSYNYRSKYFYVFGRLSSADYTDSYRQLDFSASYKVLENFTITANASNLLDETYYQYSSTPSAPTALYKNGRTFSISASFRM